MGRVKRFTRMLFRRAGDWRVFRWSTSRIDYAGEVGDPAENSIVAASLLWIARTFPEAPPLVGRLDFDTGESVPDRRHRMLKLLQRPNGYYSGSVLWMATTVDYNATGNAYWIILPNAFGEPVEAWYAPSWMMTPIGSETEYLSGYRYEVPGEDPVMIDPRLVIHFRYGLDSEDDRKGYSPLRTVLREIFTDNEAAAFTASILRNMGVPGIMVSPKSMEGIDYDEAKATKADLQTRYTGPRRGEPMVSTTPVDVEQFGFSPEQLLQKELRRVPEERVSSILGIPAVVVGLGAGLDRSTFTNMGEARVAAYEAGLIPMQRIMSEEIRFQLLPLYGDDPFARTFGFDLTKVRCLQEDTYRQSQRADLLYRGGLVSRGEGRRMIGLPITDADNVYIQQSNTTLVDEDGQAIGQPAGSQPPAPPTGGDQAAELPDPASAELAAIVSDEVLRGMERKELTTA